MDYRNAKIGFVGFGSMASAICDGLLAKEVVSGENMMACARSWDKLVANCEKRGIKPAKTADEVIEFADIVVIGVLPQQVCGVVQASAEALKGKAIFSIAAGVEYRHYVEYLGEGYNHISTIPNTPIAVGEGIIIAEETNSLTPEQKELFEGVFGQISAIEYFSTDLLALGGTGAGCSPAFVDVFIEALADGLVKNGMSRAKAYSIVPQMMMGTAKYFMESGQHPGALKDAVCSPGGTTIVGVSALEEKGFRHAVIHAIDKIVDKKKGH